jgi:hypothetical protein
MNRQQIARERQNVVALNGINRPLRKILAEFDITFQTILAELQSVRATQQELAKTLTPRTAPKYCQIRPERAANLPAAAEMMDAKASPGPSRTQHKGPVTGDARTQ